VGLPLNSAACRVHDTLGASAGDLVTVSVAAAVADRLEGTAR
jgi:hypothetical protein